MPYLDRDHASKGKAAQSRAQAEPDAYVTSTSSGAPRDSSAAINPEASPFGEHDLPCSFPKCIGALC